MKKVAIYLSLLVILSCSVNTTKPRQITPTKTRIDSTLIKPYLQLIKNASNRETEFIHDVISTIEKFQNKILDTTVQVIGRIDSDDINDTILSHIFVIHDTVLVQSLWKRKGELLWKHELKNPYLWISDNEVFEFSKRSIWVTFTIGYKYAVPRLIKKSTFNELQAETRLGIGYLNKNGYKIDETSYEQYISNFQGSIIEFDDPEIHPSYIWFEPLKRFVLFWVG